MAEEEEPYHVLVPLRRVKNTSHHVLVPYSDTNQSIKEGNNSNLLLGKRKFSIGSFNTATLDKRPRTASDTTPPSTPTSSCESKQLKIDLIVAETRITTLEARVNTQNTIREEMQILFEEEKASLVEQIKRDERALSEMEGRLENISKREQDLGDEYNEAMKQHRENKEKWDKDKGDLLKQIADLKDQLLEADVTGKGQISEMKKDMDELLQALEGAQSEVEILKKEVVTQTARAEHYITIKNQHDKQSFELHQVTSKVRELEYERDSYKDWQQQSKTAQKRLSNMAELEKEVARLRSNERSLRDTASNKLLLEEQVHNMTERLQALQPIQKELQDAKVKVAGLESSLEEWVNVGRTRGADTPHALAAALDNALQHELEAATNTMDAQTQLATLKEEMATLKYERDKVTCKMNDLITICRDQKSHIKQLQNRLLLVTRERESYRQQLDCYEKELTVSLCGDTGAGSTALLTARVEHLEKALQGYRDLLQKDDQDNQHTVIESLRAKMSKWRDEAQLAKRDVTKFMLQRDSLQSRIENLIPTGPQPVKILHLIDNPTALAQKQVHAELEAAQEEIKKLKAALQEGDSQGCPDDTNALKQKLENSKKMLQRMKEEFTSSAQEYRDVCYMLLGYKLDCTGHKNYRISSMYAESAEEYLTFTLCDDSIEMEHTGYSTTLEDLVKLHLRQHASVPMFLSALTMKLFTETTQMNIE